MKRFGLAMAIVAGLVVSYMAIHLALIEVGQEIVVLHRWGSDAEVSETRLWIVDARGSTWLHHGWADSAWIRRLETDPVVTVERGGAGRQYRGSLDPGAEAEVHGLLRDKYGLADRLVRFWWGTHTDTGLLTGETCKAVPIRLDLIE